ncbi:hypothetical protein J2W46_006829 [Paraburkholderia strydomiana]|nr:hypothetical protein [Paraburkholderia strydomiana]
MVAAHNGDLAAARQCGLKTAFVLRPVEHGPDQQSDLHAEQPWDYEAADLYDLATRLRCPTYSFALVSGYEAIPLLRGAVRNPALVAVAMSPRCKCISAPDLIGEG